MAEAKAIGYLDLNITGFEQAISTAKKAFAGLAALFVADKIKDFFVGGTKDAIDFGNAMYFAGQKLGGFDPGKLLLVDKALENAGLSASEAQSKVEEFLESKRDLSTIFGGAEQYAKALQEAGRVYGSQADILSTKAEAFAKVFQTLDEVGGKLKTFFLAGTAEFLEPLEAVMEALNEIDLAGVGKSFGAAISLAVEGLSGLFKEGKFLSTLQGAFIIAVKTAIEYAVGGVKYISAILSDEVASALSNVPWGDIGRAVLKGLISVGDWLITAIQKGIAALSAGISWAILGMLNALPAKLREWLTGTSEKADNNLGDIFKDTTARTDEMFAPIHEKSQSAEDFFSRATSKTSAKFEPTKIFDGLDKQASALADTFKGAASTGREMAKTHSSLSKIKINHAALQPQQSFKGIGDSLAKIGGGGGFVRTGLNLQERTLIRQTEIQKESLQVQKSIDKKTQPSSLKLN